MQQKGNDQRVLTACKFNIWQSKSTIRWNADTNHRNSTELPQFASHCLLIETTPSYDSV